MLILASDTTGKSLAVALVKDGRLVGESRFNLGYNHAVTHLPQVMSLLQSCATSLDAVDLLAVTQGPGSFTGTRIGLSSFKALAFAAHKPLVGVSTLETLAFPWRQIAQTLVCPVLDARNGRVYAACYRQSDLMAIAAGLSHTPLVQPGNYQAAEFLTQLAGQVDHHALSGHPHFTHRRWRICRARGTRGVRLQPAPWAWSGWTRSRTHPVLRQPPCWQKPFSCLVPMVTHFI